MSNAQQPPSMDEMRAQVSRMLAGLPQGAPIAATVTFVVDKTKDAIFAQAIETLAVATRKLPGLNVFNYHRHMPDPTGDGQPRYLIYEDWQTVAYFRPQWESEHLKTFQYAVGAWVTAPPDLQFYWGASYGARLQVLATGQTRCWDGEGKEVKCKGTGMDGNYQAGKPFGDPAFTDNGDGTVTDNRTGLIWLKNANSYGEVSWDQALGNAKQLKSGHHGLKDGSAAGDWRLPNINELQSLLYLDNDSGPAIHPSNPFTNLHVANYWSSSSVAAAPALGWYSAIAVGPPVFDLKMNAMRMWPVRGTTNAVAQTGQTRCYDTWGQVIDGKGSGQDGELRMGVPLPENRFQDNSNGTVTDTLTGLTWLKDANALGSRNWTQALTDCRLLGNGQGGLSDGSRAGDWRLPNLNELRSLIDYDYFGPALRPGNPFVNVRTSLYWSSTTIASAPNQARFVFVGIGPSVWDHKSVNMGVWPVKGGV